MAADRFTHDDSGVPTDMVTYGPDIGTETEYRLLGELKGKRVLELGCGAVPRSIAFAKQGATAIGVEPSARLLAAAKDLRDREGVKVELHHGDLADLAFLRADSLDLAFSSYAFDQVDNLDRLFRQVHRVLKVGAPLVFAVSHPAWRMVDESDPQHPPILRRSYFDPSPGRPVDASVEHLAAARTISELFMALVRASYRVDAILEPEPSPGAVHGSQWRETFRWVPRALVVRARKEGN